MKFNKNKKLSKQILGQTKEMIKQSKSQVAYYEKLLQQAEVNLITAQAIIDGLK